MGFMVPYVAGIVACGVVAWRLKRRKQHRQTRWLGTQLVPTIVPDRSSGPSQAAAESAREQRDGADAAGEEVGAAAPVPEEVSKQLEKIKGIGPVYARRLYAARISTFADLAALTPEQVLAIVAPREGAERLIDPQGWITQARLFASGDEQEPLQEPPY